MPGGLGPRFALEAAFLILLAGVAAYARLDATEIIFVMAGGWLLASIFEVLAAQRERLFPGATWERPVEADEPSEVAEDEPSPKRRPSWLRRRGEPTVAAVETAEPSEPSPPEAPAARVDDEATGEIEVPKRRRWFRRQTPAPEPPVAEPVARPSARHVRLIKAKTHDEAQPPSSEESATRKDAEAGPR
jgi:hypothetical protein